MTDQYKRLVATLQEIFQLDQADLDFGIYRIMNQKRKEITDFLENRLLVQVKETLAKGSANDGAALQQELSQKESTLRELGVDPDTNDKVLELRQQVKASGSPEALTNEVFSHLTSFFRRYYHQGDFISQRRYKKDVYAIPYEGEEVKLHWANHDQYYIKTSEYFKNYVFKIEGGKTVTFALRDASTEQNNNKAQSNKERRFRLAEEDFLTTENDELKIWFTYEPADKKEKQDALMADALKAVTGALEAADFKPFRNGLLKAEPTEKNKDRTMLEKQLKTYTARNTFDYFIHKDLGGFLTRELDFYIKNEILQIDDIDLNNTQSFEHQLSSIKALKGVAQPIISMLAQLENFQKKLWLKKKFVVQSDWCITLDRIPEAFYADIAANEAQHQEWVTLFAIDELKADLTNPGYRKKLTVEFFKANPFLLVDTQFFSTEWKYKLLGQLDHLDQQNDGLLINSENYQALRHLTCRYESSIDSAYLDPPYNTNASELNYINDYKHSTWITFMENRLLALQPILKPEAVSCITIDHVEIIHLKSLLETIGLLDNDLGLVTIVNNPSGRSTVKGMSISNEYALFLGKSELSSVGFLKRSDEQLKQYPEIDDKGKYQWRSFLRAGGANDFRSARPKLFYPICVKDGAHWIPSLEWDEKKREYNILDNLGGVDLVLWPESNGTQYTWRLGVDSLNERLNELRIRQNNKGNWTADIKFRLDERGVLPKTVWIEKKHNATAYGTTLLRNIFGNSQLFAFPKSIYAVEDSVSVSTSSANGVTIDYFAGSGTTGHAVINLNREDGGQRKYILVEMGEYFNTVTKPRIQKVVYSNDWKDGKPVSRIGSSHCFKYMRLESYEDTLNNLELQRTDQQESLLEQQGFADEYMLHYMLNVESRDSLLNSEAFKRPFGYKINVTENNELREQEVDLVETFNYLIGLVVENVQLIRGTVVVQGRNLEDEKVLVIWRDVEQMDNAALNTFFQKLAINTKDTEFIRMYVNGDNNLENLRTDDEQWKVVLIEQEFHKRMFDTKDV